MDFQSPPFSFFQDGCVLSLNDGLRDEDPKFSAMIGSDQVDDELDDEIVFRN